MKKIIAALALILLSAIAATAQNENVVRVLPWNNHRAAVSLTFDDGLPVQLVFALPAMNARHMRGTFFLCPENLKSVESWKAALVNDEIGNHTNTHPHLTQISEGNRIMEIASARAYLETTFERSASSFAYPFEDSNPDVEADAKQFSFMARGYADQVYITPSSNVDWYRVGSQVARTSYNLQVYKGWITEALQAHAWVTFQYHGFAGVGYEPVPVPIFEQTLDYLSQEPDVWVAPFGEVGAYFRGSQIFESAAVKHSNGEYVYDWTLPTGFPRGVVLKVRLNGRGRVFKHKEEIFPDKGVYSVPLDCGEIFVVPEDRREPRNRDTGKSYARNAD